VSNNVRTELTSSRENIVNIFCRTNELEDLKRKLQDSQTENNSLKDKLDIVSSKAKSITEHLKSNLAESHSEMNKITLDKLKDIEVKCRDEIRDHAKKEMEKMVKVIEDETKKKFDFYQLENKTLKDKLISLQLVYKTLVGKYETIKLENKSLRDKLDSILQFNGKYEIIKLENESFQSKLDSLKLVNKDIELKYETVRLINKDLQLKYETVQLINKDIEIQHETIISENKSLKDKLGALQTENKSLRDILEDLQEEHKALEDKLESESVSNIIELKNNLNNIENENTMLIIKLNDLEEDNNTMKDKLNKISDISTYTGSPRMILPKKRKFSDV